MHVKKRQIARLSDTRIRVHVILCIRGWRRFRVNYRGSPKNNQVSRSRRKRRNKITMYGETKHI